MHNEDDRVLVGYNIRPAGHSVDERELAEDATLLPIANLPRIAADGKTGDGCGLLMQMKGKFKDL